MPRVLRVVHSVGKDVMRTARIMKAACVAGLTAACLCTAAGCLSNGSASGLTGGVAATVNGVEIAEDDVTTTIQAMRESYSLEDADSWGSYLAQVGTTPETLRDNVIDSLVDRELQKEGAEERGVTIEDSEIDSYVDQIKSNYDSDEKWSQALVSAGFDDEADYRENVKEGLLSNALVESFEVEDPTDDAVVEYAKTAITFDSSKRSSHILFDINDQETAQDVLDQINAGTLDFADAAREYSTDTGSAQNGGDVGWDQLSSFVDEYQTALDDLAVGQVSGLVESDYGWHIIKCTDEFVPPEEISSIDQLPQEFIDTLRQAVKQQDQQAAYQTWFDEFKEGAEIVVNDMPDGLPYAVDMSQYQTEDDSTDSTASSSDESITDDASSDAADGESTNEDSGSEVVEGESSDATGQVSEAA